LEEKYFMDRFNEIVFAGGARLLGGQLWKKAVQGLIDGLIVNDEFLDGEISSIDFDTGSVNEI